MTFYSTFSIIYVDGEYRGNTPIGDLRHDFNCSKPADMKIKLLADRARYFKEDERSTRELLLLKFEFEGGVWWHRSDSTPNLF